MHGTSSGVRLVAALFVCVALANCAVVSGLDAFRLSDGEGEMGGAGVGSSSGTAGGGGAEPVCTVEVCEGPEDVTDENCDGQSVCSGGGLFTVGLGLATQAWGLRVGAGSDPQGNIVVAGIQGADVDQGTLIGPRMFLARYSSAGDLVSKREIGDAGSFTVPWGLAVGGDESLVVTGQLKGSADFDGPSSTAGDHVSVGDALFVASFANDLALKWVKAFGGGSLSQSRVALSSNGEILVGGEVDGGVTFGSTTLTSASGAIDGFVTKLDDGGNLVWSRQLHAGMNSTVRVRGLAIEPATQDVFIAGYFKGSIDLDGPNNPDNPVSSSGSSDDVFVVRLSGLLGIPLWQKTAGDDLPQRLTGLAIDANDDVVVTGGFRGNLDFGGTLLQGSIDNDAIFVTKLDGFNGDHVWSKSSQANSSQHGEAGAIAVDGADQILIAGYATGNLGFCPVFPMSAAGQYAFVAKLAANGDCLWARRPSQPGEQAALAVAADPLGHVLLTGRFIDTVDFGGNPSAPTTAPGATDAFLARLLP